MLQDNFQQLQSQPPFQNGNRLVMNSQVTMICAVEGYPRPVVFWRLRRISGEVVPASCPQGIEGQYTEIPADQRGQQLIASNIVVSSILLTLNNTGVQFLYMRNEKRTRRCKCVFHGWVGGLACSLLYAHPLPDPHSLTISLPTIKFSVQKRRQTTLPTQP